MINLSTGIAIGLIVGGLEISMVRTYQKNKIVLASIVLHWIVIGGLIAIVDFGLSTWATGLILGVGLTLPPIFRETLTSRNAAIHTNMRLAIAYFTSTLAT